jgi:cytochrome P450
VSAIEALPPGPGDSPLIQSLNWAFRPTQYLEQCRRRYGETFTLRLIGFGSSGRSPLVLLTDPGVVKRIFTGDPEVLRAGAGRKAMEPLFGSRSILLADQPEHLRKRRLMLPPFHGERLGAYRELIEEVVEAEVARWPLDRPVQLQSRMQAITLEVILRAVFGLDEPEQRAEVRGGITGLLRLVANPLAELTAVLPRRLGPLDLQALLGRAARSADRALLGLIAARRADPGLAQRKDILSLLLQARDADGGRLGDAELRDDLVTLLMAGHETTATALAWTFDELFSHPDAAEPLAEECSQEGSGERPYLEAVITESLRLHPPLPIVDRELAAPLEIDGHFLPAGTIAAPCVYLIHRRADLYREPHHFRPERFLDRAPGTYTWIPFGGGVRRCLGGSFALFEMRIVLRAVLQRVTLRRASPGGSRARRRAIVLAPGGGVPAIVERGPGARTAVA